MEVLTARNGMEEAREAAWNHMATTRDGSDFGMQPMTKKASADDTAARKAMMVPAPQCHLNSSNNHFAAIVSVLLPGLHTVGCLHATLLAAERILACCKTSCSAQHLVKPNAWKRRTKALQANE